jgi:hypothetical protein
VGSPYQALEDVTGHKPIPRLCLPPLYGYWWWNGLLVLLLLLLLVVVAQNRPSHMP